MTKKHKILIAAISLVVLAIVGAVYVEQRVGSTMEVVGLGELLKSQPIMPGMDLPQLGEMPELEGLVAWINSPELTKEDLEGKVVLIDFWTYSCINCIRTFPFLKSWWEKYQDEDFILIGIHTPEFSFEKDLGNVQSAALQNGLTYPIALDNDYVTWRNFNNRFWPASYLFDKEGQLRYRHFGEGNYDETELAIQQLLAVDEELTQEEEPDFEKINSPETYFGYGRMERNSSTAVAGSATRDVVATYIMQGLKLNYWGFEGNWKVAREYAEASEEGARLTFKYNAGSANFVMAPPSTGPVEVDVFVDESFVQTITVDHSDLYKAYASDPEEHQITLVAKEAGLQIYSVTFGD